MGIASFYVDKFKRNITANGKKYRQTADKTLPLGTVLKVKNLESSKEVTMNDRSPFVKGRIIDSSKLAAKKTGFINQSIAKVEITLVGDSDESRKPYSTIARLVDADNNSLKIYCSVSVNKQYLEGFGVEIGSFIEMVNLVQLADELQNAFNDRIFIQVSVIQKVKCHKIIVRKLKNRKKQINYKTNQKRVLLIVL